MRHVHAQVYDHRGTLRTFWAERRDDADRAYFRLMRESGRLTGEVLVVESSAVRYEAPATFNPDLGASGRFWTGPDTSCGGLGCFLGVCDHE